MKSIPFASESLDLLVQQRLIDFLFVEQVVCLHRSAAWNGSLFPLFLHLEVGVRQLLPALLEGLLRLRQAVLAVQQLVGVSKQPESV